MTSSQRDRAEAAFGHLQHAAREMILAAHDGLDILDEAVSTTGLGEIFDRLNEVGETILRRTWPGPGGPATADTGSSPGPPPATDSSGPRIGGRVERIPVL